ncbi:hypothetical protein LWC33_34475 [Pseudonocardia sp. RS11V-5]|uniref:hypothetical protein n=1 Tax=Pseudonocardia terrae TaxID=2905831 RepID=UPI001E441095|nr:hypothetical protein [Pseudonocardia terrae]MCE3556532.1 hypothetical protein [Pseudonocardia terrae]
MVQRHRAEGASVLVRGETGTGRRTVARALVTPPVVELDGPTAGPDEVGALSPCAGTVMVPDVDLLDPAVAALLDRRAGELGFRLVLTSTGPVVRGHPAALVARCPVHLDLPPLRARRDRLPSLAAGLLRERSADRLRFNPRALRTLASKVHAAAMLPVPACGRRPGSCWPRRPRSWPPSAASRCCACCSPRSSRRSGRGAPSGRS